MKTILFPTDFSEVSENAFEYALHLAEQLDAWIVLLHVHHYSRVNVDLLPGGMIQALEQEQELEALRQLQLYEESVQQRLGKRIKVMHKLEFGFPKEQILISAKEIQSDLIIMGTTGASSTINKLLGSVCAHTIKCATCPVLAVPAQAKYRPIERIAYATNFEEKIEIFDRLIEFGKLLNSQISCVHIKSKKKGWDLTQLDFFNELFREKINTHELDFYLQNSPDVVEGLSKFAADQQIDVLAMLTHKQALLKQIFHPSLSRKMALITQVPLLVFQEINVEQLVR